MSSLQSDDLPPPIRRKRLQGDCWNDPARFAREYVIWGEDNGLTPYQEEILSSLVRRKRVCIRAPHGTGKSSLMAIAIIWFACTRNGVTDWKIPTTASVWRQLNKFLWPEVHKWARRLDFEAMGIERWGKEQLMGTSLRLSTGEAFALASSNSELIEGAHASQILYIFDESKAIPNDTWSSAEGAMSTGVGAYWLSASTPGDTSGVFYDIHQRKVGYEDWLVRHITLSEAIDAGRISGEWAEQRARQWGRNSALYLNRVLGEFASDDASSTIPLSWVEAANDRWYSMEEHFGRSAWTSLGVDVARFGGDSTVISFCYGDLGVGRQEPLPKGDSTEIASRVISELYSNPGGKATIDVIGIGAGVYDIVRAVFPDRVYAFNGATSTPERDISGEWTFPNTRCAAWWKMRERLDPSISPIICLPPEESLTADLVAPTYRYIGKDIRIEVKEEVAKRIGRSTDFADSAIISMWSQSSGGGMESR